MLHEGVSATETSSPLAKRRQMSLNLDTERATPAQSTSAPVPSPSPEGLPEGVKPEYVPYLERTGLPREYWSQLVSDVRAIVCSVFDHERIPLDR
jgi:hypothetical protein